MKLFQHNQPFLLENGFELPKIEIAYSTYGSLNDDHSNVIWICHALTANSDAASWWPGMIGENCLFDTNKYFIVCANILGSCYGTTGPLSIDPNTGEPYYNNFPLVTIRDMVKAHILLKEYLGIRKIDLLAGGSMGGYQVLEWAVMEPDVIQKLFLISTSAKETAWGIAIHSAQRLAIEADGTWNTKSRYAGANGLKAARAFGMITYRSYESYVLTQTDPDENKLDHYKASSYIHYQGEKLVRRFNAYSYWYLTKSMDNHNLARHRAATVEDVLGMITQPSILIGIRSDLLCPPHEQHFLAHHMTNTTVFEIDSLYGHDGFLVETREIANHVAAWMQKYCKVAG
ncbi:MAG: homoserine O-acetyltransferase MetX [Candidatus Dadabacteria bacterium]